MGDGSDMNWYGIKDTDPRAVALYSRHYSAQQKASNDKWLRHGISGPGETMVLLTVDGRALFGWIHNVIERYDKQIGVNCFVFRNEGPVTSSDLVIEASELAQERWPGKRLFTYVNAGKITSVNPGYCYKKAGWSYVGKSKGGLHILELLSGI